jgi:hypothetical protein
MEDLRDENRLEQARTSARRAAAKGERAAEALGGEAADTADDLKKLGGKAAGRLRSAGENAYEEFSDAAEEGAGGLASAAQAGWGAASHALRAAWENIRAEIEQNPVRSVVIALAAGIVFGGILAPRE